MLKNIGMKALKTAVTCLIISLLTALFCILSFVIYAKTDPNLNIQEFYEIAKAQDKTTKLYYISSENGNGSVARELENEALFSQQNREWVKFENIPSNLTNAFIAIEDHRFYTHKGIDLKRTAGAIVGFVTGNSSYGGSTINQQLIKNITGNDDYSVSRKIREMIKAYKLDKSLSKEEILELYLNTIYLSENSYGIGVASENYFGKSVGELSLTECAALACIPQSPTKWDPIRNPENNSARRSTVLNRMAELGYITGNELDNSLSDELSISKDRTRNKESEAVYSWYTESVIDECLDLLVENKIAVNRQTAKKLLYTGGLSVITAQNPKMQKAVEQYFADENNFYHSGLIIHPECSMVIIDPTNGNILALAGATGSKSSNRTLNYATYTKRSPGSSIKPLSVYAPALDKGLISYGTVIDDTPCKFVSNGMGGFRGWPQNFPQSYRGLTTVRDAICRSVNTVAVKTLNLVGTDYSFSLLRDGMEMKSLIKQSDENGTVYTDIAESPLALGQLTRGVTVSEITSGYTALANKGYFNKGKTVVRILDSDGKVLIDNSSEPKKLFSEQSAAIMTKLLSSVTKSGTASAMTLKNSIECVGKTGTTTSDCDRWFIGYTPDLLAGVWFGYPTPKSLDGYPLSPSPALKTFDNIIKLLSTEEYLGRAPKTRFDETEGIVTAKYCKDSGKLISSACLCDPRGNRAEIGYFTKESVPTEYCNVHKMVLYDCKNGGVAGSHCPQENCKYIGLLNITRRFPHDVVISDAQYVWQNVPSGVPLCLDSSKAFFSYALPSGVFSGHSAVKIPFNRYCSGCYLEALDPNNSEYEDDISPDKEKHLNSISDEN